MTEEPDWAADDPEIAALLTFTPVPRGVERADGWSPAHQRGFIAWLAATGNRIAAARAVGRSESGAKQLRREDERGEFAAAWRRAIALHRSRQGAAEPRQPPAAPTQAREAPPPEPAEPTQAEVDAHWQLFRDKILKTYVIKLATERAARLAGCIVEADFYVRQLCWFDVVIDLAGQGVEAVTLLRGLKRDDLEVGRIAATPASLLLDHVRRSVWAKFGEPERPPPPELGLHNSAGVSTGGPRQCHGHGLSEAELAHRAEAQALWEAKARRDAAAWRARLGLPPLGEGEGDQAEDGG